MRRALVCFLLAILFLLACQISEEEKIYQVLNRREEALRKKDLSLYLSCISKTYHDKDEDFNRLQNRIEGYFKTFDRIEYASWDRSVRIEGDTARGIQELQLEGGRGGEK